MESRLDRIERALELFVQENREFQRENREARKRADEEMRDMRESRRKADEETLYLKEFADYLGRRIEELDERLGRSLKETQEDLSRSLKETSKELSDKMAKVHAELSDMGIVQGQIGEDLFYRNIPYLFKEQNLTFSDIRRNVKKKGVAEYDIVAANKDKVLVIEVKNKLEKRSVDKFLEKMLPRFKKVFPEYRDYDLIGGVGGLVVKDDVGQYAQKAGLYVLTQKGDGGAMLLNRKNFRAKSFC